MKVITQILNLIKQMFDVDSHRKTIVDTYLSAATDHYDLELRQKNLRNWGYL